MQLKPLGYLTPCRDVCRPEPQPYNLPALSCRKLPVWLGLCLWGWCHCSPLSPWQSPWPWNAPSASPYCCFTKPHLLPGKERMVQATEDRVATTFLTQGGAKVKATMIPGSGAPLLLLSQISVWFTQQPQTTASPEVKGCFIDSSEHFNPLHR